MNFLNTRKLQAALLLALLGTGQVQAMFQLPEPAEVLVPETEVPETEVLETENNVYIVPVVICCLLIAIAGGFIYHKWFKGKSKKAKRKSLKSRSSSKTSWVKENKGGIAMGILAVGEVVCLCLIWQNGKRINELRERRSELEKVDWRSRPLPSYSRHFSPQHSASYTAVEEPEFEATQTTLRSTHAHALQRQRRLTVSDNDNPLQDQNPDN